MVSRGRRGKVNRHLKFEIGDTAYVVNMENLTVDEVEVEEYDFKTDKYESRVYKEGREYVLDEEEMYLTRKQADERVDEMKKQISKSIAMLIEG